MAAYRRVDDLVTCWLTACRPTPGSAPDPTLGNGVWQNFTLFFPVSLLASTDRVRERDM